MLTLKIFRANSNEVIRDENYTNKIIVYLSMFEKSKNNKSKNLIHFSNIRAMEKPIFFILSIEKVLNCFK